MRLFEELLEDLHGGGFWDPYGRTLRANDNGGVRGYLRPYGEMIRDRAAASNGGVSDLLARFTPGRTSGGDAAARGE